MANARRVDVLIDQLECLELKYRIYKYSVDPKNKALVLVYFDDNILNIEAERQKMRI